MRTKFSRGREVLDPIMSEEEIDSTDHIFGLTPEELKLVTDVIYESVESSKTASEFITKVVESASSGTAGWNFIMGFACGKMVEGMNTDCSYDLRLRGICDARPVKRNSRLPISPKIR